MSDSVDFRKLTWAQLQGYFRHHLQLLGYKDEDMSIGGNGGALPVRLRALQNLQLMAFKSAPIFFDAAERNWMPLLLEKLNGAQKKDPHSSE